MLSYEDVRSLFDYRNGALHWRIKQGARGKIGNVAGSINSHGYVNIVINSKSYKAHRLIFLWHHGFLPEFIDHINRDKSDNRIENLRVATKSENCHNRAANVNSKSGVIGVGWDATHNRWRVRIRINYTQIVVGYFENLDDAKHARMLAEKKYHKDFSSHLT